MIYHFELDLGKMNKFDFALGTKLLNVLVRPSSNDVRLYANLYCVEDVLVVPYYVGLVMTGEDPDTKFQGYYPERYLNSVVFGPLVLHAYEYEKED